MPAANDIAVTNTPDVLTDCTADLAMGLLLAAARRIGEGERETRAGGWEGWRPTHMIGKKVSGATLGIVGFGRIGQAMARRAHGGVGMRVVFQDAWDVPAEIRAANGQAEQLGRELQQRRRHARLARHVVGRREQVPDRRSAQHVAPTRPVSEQICQIRLSATDSRRRDLVVEADAVVRQPRPQGIGADVGDAEVCHRCTHHRAARA